MVVYQLTGTRVDGGSEGWGFCPIYATRERAERQREAEIRAYTTYKGQVLFDCPYIFEINEIEVEE